MSKLGIDPVCEKLMDQAIENNHSIGTGFRDVLLLDRFPALRLDCKKCNFFILVDPETGRYIQSYTGVCK